MEIKQAKGISKEAQISFMEVSTPCDRDPIELGMDPSMLTTFLETCMKLLRDNKAVKGLQELITRCTRSAEPHIVLILGKHALHTRWEMWMMAQISKYEMDQVILDLGLGANVLPKKMWECMGRPTLQ